MKIRGLPEKGLEGKKVLVRVDFNVPLRDGAVSDDTRILAHLDTIRKLREADARITLVSHLGRPKGKVAPEFSLKPVAYRLAELTGWDIGFVDECIGPIVSEAVSSARPGSILVLERRQVPPRRGEKRRGLCTASCRTLRCLRHGRLQRGASGTRLDTGDNRFPAFLRGQPPVPGGGNARSSEG